MESTHHDWALLNKWPALLGNALSPCIWNCETRGINYCGGWLPRYDLYKTKIIACLAACLKVFVASKSFAVLLAELLKKIYA